MARAMGLRAEIDALKAEIEALRGSARKAEEPGPPPSGLEHQIAELNRLVTAMLDEAETTVAEHPVATVAGALALGIVIGRLTAR